MNNKFIAGIAAMAISASLMSTVAFAADPTFAVDGDTATLSFKVGENNADVTVSEEAQITMMAYLVDGTVATPKDIPAYSNQTVVALDQVDGAKGFGDVLIAASKLVADKKIAVVLGGSDGTTEKYLVAQEVVEDKVTVTVMNGADSIVIEAAEGKVTLPADTAFNKTVNTGYTLAIYSWVTADGKTEYLAGAEVDAAALEGVTLYAKYVVNGLVIGDTNGNGTLEATDRTFLYQYTVNGRNVGKMGKSYADLTGLAELAGIVGDTNGNGTLEATDRTFLYQYTVNGRNVGQMGKTIYYVNK